MARTIENRITLYHAGAIAANAAVTQIPFDAADLIVNVHPDYWALDAATDEITVPEDGLYRVFVWGNITTGGGTSVNFDVQADDGGGYASVGDRDVNLEGTADHWSSMFVVSLNAGDLVEFYVDPGASNMSLTDTTIELVRVANQ